ncbi:MAG: sulfite reductase subunit alpha [Phycisphaerae bacterium]
MNATNTLMPPIALAAASAAPVLPESAPFTSAQRAWLNGFFAGMVGTAGAPAVAVPGMPVGSADVAAPAAPEAEEDFPWHDPAMSLADRLDLAKEKPIERKLMAAMAQLDCGACGYVCQSYAEHIADGSEKNLTLCMPGGKDTSAKLKELVQLGIKTGGAAKPAAPIGNGQSAIGNPAYSRSNPFPARVVMSKPLNGAGSDKDTRHVVFDLKGSGLTYKPGDALGVWPENCPDLATEIMELIGASGAEDVAGPDGEPMSLFEALVRRYVITTPTDDLVSLLGHDPVDGLGVVDLLKKAPAERRPTAEALVAALSPINPRLYSISSSIRACPEQVHLTVGVVRYRNGAGTACKGVCSTFLAERVRPGQKVRIFFHASPKFGLPASGDTPVIMVGPGTGVAPFRSFLQERAAAGSKGENWLFFGDQRSSCDFLYEKELTDLQRGGTLTKLSTAFSRDQEKKIYVQTRMIEQQADLWRWLENGAHFYVCGDAKRMAKDVDAALKQVVREQGGMSEEKAEAYVADLTKSGRYQRDVY